VIKAAPGCFKGRTQSEPAVWSTVPLRQARKTSVAVHSWLIASWKKIEGKSERTLKRLDIFVFVSESPALLGCWVKINVGSHGPQGLQ
jgi:hypothetical protein